LISNWVKKESFNSTSTSSTTYIKKVLHGEIPLRKRLKAKKYLTSRWAFDKNQKIIIDDDIKFLETIKICYVRFD